jgi:putative transposase
MPGNNGSNLFRYSDTSAALTKLKREFSWLGEVSCVPLQAGAAAPGLGNNFWKRRARYPRFRSKHGVQSAEFTRRAFAWRDGELTLAKIGRLHIRWSRSFSGEPSTVTVSKTPAGRYYVSIRVDGPVKSMPAASGIIGIDLGLTAFAVTSEGTKYRAPRPLRRKLAALRRAQKSLSRKKRGSQNYRRARLRVARLHEKLPISAGTFCISCRPNWSAKTKRWWSKICMCAACCATGRWRDR